MSAPASFCSQVSAWHNLWRMRRICLWTLRVLVAASLSGTLAHGQKIPEPKPVWRTDLQQAGFVPQHLFQFSLPPRFLWTETLMSRESLAFGCGGRIVLAFLTQEVGGSGRSFHVVDTSRKLHIISLDAATGRIVANRTWPAPRLALNRADVGAIKEGNFAALNCNALCVYSPDLQEIDRIDLPAYPADSDSRWSMSVAPGGDVVFLRHYLNGKWSLRMLTASPLREVRRWDKSEETGSASEKYFAKTGENNTLYARGFDTPWRAIADLGPCRPAWMRAEVRFISEDSVVVSGCDPVQLIRVDGQVLFTAHPPRNRLPGYAWGSLDGRYVAMATTTTKGLGIALAFDMSHGPAPRRILVYDTKSGSPVAALKFTWQHACAFSPDGSTLAVLRGGIIEMYSLPRSGR